MVRRFFATLAEECTWEVSSIKADMGSEPFKATGARLIEAGWRYYYPYSKAEEHILPELKESERLRSLRRRSWPRRPSPRLGMARGGS